jgi:hypothetical protein
MKVGFLDVGAQKAGTSVLDAYLRAHPALCKARMKEVHLFDDERTFHQRSLSGFDAYHRKFAPTPATALLGEITPAYMHWNDAPRRIWEYNRAMRLIAVLRNPITRAFSQWNMQRDRGIEPLSFWDALQSERERCRAALPRGAAVSAPPVLLRRPGLLHRAAAAADVVLSRGAGARTAL